MTILYDKVNQQNNDLTIIVYLDPHNTEFANEREGIKVHVPLKQEVRNYIRSKYPQLKTFTVKVMIGSILVGSYLSSDLNVSAQTIESNQPTYTIQSGDTLYSLAREYKTTVGEIKELNDMDSNLLSTGKQIVLPNFHYTVSKGDTLYSIAHTYDTSVQQLKSLNNLKTDFLNVGQRILVPNKEAETETISNAPLPKTEDVEVAAEEMFVPTTGYESYIVAPGDYLAKIAKQHNTTVEKLKEINNLTSDMIYVGQKLSVPVVKDTPEPSTDIKPVEEPVNTTSPVTESEPATTTEEETANNPVEEEQTTAANTSTHIVTAGDTLYSISRKYNVSVDELTAFNELTSNTIYLGQQINIPSKLPTKIEEPEKEPEVIENTTEIVEYEMVDYTVVKGDTLNKIANRFKTTTSAIKETNKLQTDTIYVNQKLTIPVLPGTDYTAPNAPVMESNSYLSNVNDSILKMQGVTDPNAIVDITITDGVTKQNIQERADTSGHYSISFDASGFKDGNLEVRVSATDESGNKSIETVKNLTKDTAIPPTPILAGTDTITSLNEHQYTIQGTADRNANVFVSVKDETGKEVSQNGSTNAEGQFSFTLNLENLSGSTYSVDVYQVSSIGNKSDVTSKQLNVDTSGPSELALDSLNTISGDNVHEYAISGRTEANSNIHIIISGVTNSVLADATADANGRFSLPLDLSQLNDGNLTISVMTEDQLGNKGTVEERVILKDTIAPEWLTATFENNGMVAQLNEESFHINGTSSDQNATIQIEITDGEQSFTSSALVVDGRYSIPVDVSSLKDGQLTVLLSQNDEVGNISEVQQYYIQKDTVSEFPVVEKSQIVNKAGSYLFTFSGQGEPNSMIEVVASGNTTLNEITARTTVNEDGTFQLTMDLTSIKNDKPFIMAKQIDEFGNESKNVITGVTSYIIGSGDSLWKIATQFNTSISEIQALNNMTTSTLMIGQELKLPAIAGVNLSVVLESEIFNMGYLYFGDSATFTESVLKTQGTMNVVSPTYFDLNTDGTLKLTSQFDRSFIANMQSNGIRVVPFLSNHWNRAVGEAALDNREQLAREIADTIMKYNLDGINVDIENVTHEYRNEYSDFVQLLRDLLPADKEVSVAVAANPTGQQYGWHGSYDYTDLATNSDYLMIMAYDESYPGSAPGPIASIDFVEDSIQYALAQGVPKEKIVVGIGHYGRYWKDGTSYGGNGISNQQIQQAIELYDGVVSFEEASQSAKATFTIEDGDPPMYVYGELLMPGSYTVWYENEQSIQAKLELVEKYGVKGTGNWGVEQENPEFWETFGSWVKE